MLNQEPPVVAPLPEASGIKRSLNDLVSSRPMPENEEETVPTPSRMWPTPRDFAEEISLQVQLLEQMFGPQELARLLAVNPNHPIAARYRQLEELQRGRAIPPGDELRTGALIASGLLDRSSWAANYVAADDPWTLIEDAQARAKVRSRLSDAGSYGDVMSELFFLGCLRAMDFPASLIEEEGKPDIVLVEDPEDPLWLEVKRVRPGSTPRSVAADVKKANRQIRGASGDQAGVLYFQIDTAHLATPLDDKVPPHVKKLVREVRQQLRSGFNRSIAHAVVCWDDCLVLGNAPSPSLFAFRRRSVHISHPSPRPHPNIPPQVLVIGRTVTVWTRYSPQTAPRQAKTGVPLVGNFAVTQQYRDLQTHAGGIRPEHAALALTEPDGIFELDLGGLRLTMAVKTSDIPTPHLLLVVSSQRGGSDRELVDGYRLFPSQSDLLQLATDPRRSMSWLVKHFGLPIVVGSETGLLLPFVHLDGFTGGALLTLAGPLIPFEAHLVARQGPTGVDVAWAYAIDSSRYRTSAAVGLAHPQPQSS
jgi:hypothetical protein